MTKETELPQSRNIFFEESDELIVYFHLDPSKLDSYERERIYKINTLIDELALDPSERDK